MLISLSSLRRIIKESLNEISYNEFINPTESEEASSHELYTGQRNNKKYFIKFPEIALQTLNEYMAYKIYQLYAEKNPDYVIQPDDVYVVIHPNLSVGIATSASEGKEINGRNIIHYYGQEIYDAFAEHVGSRYYIDAFMANWDQSKNILIAVEKNEEGKYKFKKSTAIDPGGWGPFRARGERKGRAFGKEVGELKTFLDPNVPGANSFIFPKRNDAIAREIFLSVSINEILQRINEVCIEVCEELKQYGLNSLCAEFEKECQDISSILKDRHEFIMNKIE